MSLITPPLPTRIDGHLIRSEGRDVNATNASGWLLAPTLWIGDVSYGLGVVVDLVASWALTVAQVAAIATANPSTVIEYRVTVGVGDALRSVYAGFLVVSDQNKGANGSSIELSAGVAQSAIAQSAMVAAQAAAVTASDASLAAAAAQAATEAILPSLSSTYVTFKRSDNGQPITGGHISVQVDPTTHDIIDIAWEA